MKEICTLLVKLHIIFPECKELTSMLDPLLYRWGVPPVVIRCVHCTMQMGVLQTWIKAQGIAIVMAGHQCNIPWVLQPTVSRPQEDGRCSSGDRPLHSQPPHGSSTLQDGDTGIRSVIRSQEWTVSIDIRDAYRHVPMHQAVRKYLRFVVNKQVYQFTCLPNQS